MGNTRGSMDIPINAEVHCTDGRSGTISTVTINPITRRLTNVVVRYEGQEYLVPRGRVAATTPDLIVLDCTRKELTELEPFLETYFIDYGLADEELMNLMEGDYLVEPFVGSELGIMQTQQERIPAGELTMRRGNKVLSEDDEIGVVDEFAVTRETGDITHLILREGHLWGKREIAIPVSAIQNVDSDTIVLNLSKAEIDALPVMRVSRWWD